MQYLLYLHNKGLFHGNINPSNIFLTDSLWVKMGPSLILSSPPTYELLLYRDLIKNPDIKIDLPSFTSLWARGELSNFDYLMIINNAAGRTMNDNCLHPIMPWVTDFTSPDNIRDFRYSKFRMQKGDNQLDFTYNNSEFPHHIAENLSELTYTIYMSRRMPMYILKQVVRRNFIAKEYPEEYKYIIIII